MCKALFSSPNDDLNDVNRYEDVDYAFGKLGIAIEGGSAKEITDATTLVNFEITLLLRRVSSPSDLHIACKRVLEHLTAFSDPVRGLMSPDEVCKDTVLADPVRGSISPHYVCKDKLLAALALFCSKNN